MPDGHQLIAGHWQAGEGLFANHPVTGAPRPFTCATPAQLATACAEAEAAFSAFSALPAGDRARLLEAIAEALEARGPDLTAAGCAETGLPEARLEGERARTTGQLRHFAAVLRRPDWASPAHDPALPDRKPLPRPELFRIDMALGPVAVFGASNFPLAFSVAGGDTASALAAGCPVVVRGHPAHPATGEIAAEAIAGAIAAQGLPGGVFSFLQGPGHDLGAGLVQAPQIAAVGFTGSPAGGQALARLCAARPVPIPFYGELGAVNPVFLLPAALAARGAALARDWVASLTLGAGQFCTNPGVVVLAEGLGADAFSAEAEALLRAAPAQTMLTPAIASAYHAGAARTAAATGAPAPAAGEGRQGLPVLLQVSGDDWLANPALAHEVFGPFGLIVRCTDTTQMQEVAACLEGQLTATLQLVSADHALARTLVPVLARKAGRVLANGWPTGVEVADSMVHGGPWPATTHPGFTSVGSLAIRRWLRPVCFQNLPHGLLPAGLRA